MSHSFKKDYLRTQQRRQSEEVSC